MLFYLILTKTVLKLFYKHLIPQFSWKTIAAPVFKLLFTDFMKPIPSGSDQPCTTKDKLSAYVSILFLLDICRIGTFGHSYALKVELLGPMILS